MASPALEWFWTRGWELTSSNSREKGQRGESNLEPHSLQETDLTTSTLFEFLARCTLQSLLRCKKSRQVLSWFEVQPRLTETLRLTINIFFLKKILTFIEVFWRIYCTKRQEPCTPIKYTFAKIWQLITYLSLSIFFILWTENLSNLAMSKEWHHNFNWD